MSSTALCTSTASQSSVGLKAFWFGIGTATAFLTDFGIILVAMFSDDSISCFNACTMSCRTYLCHNFVILLLTLGVRFSPHDSFDCLCSNARLLML